MAVPAETFFLDPESGLTLQQQIQHVVVEAILSGRCLPGEKMPSSRQLAKHLGVARITVTVAYTELVSNEYLISRGRSGYFVAPTAPTRPVFDVPAGNGKSGVDWSRIISQSFAGEEQLVRPSNWRDFRYPFIYGQSDARLFDHHNWRACALKAVGRKDFDMLATDFYERDDPMLVENILRQILPRRGISARPDEILITMGAQNALWITAQILLNQRRTGVMENPCYPALRQVLDQTRCRTVAIDVDAKGLPPEDIPDEADVVFTTPSHHCPTNATMPLARRRDLLERASREEFIIVEDDYEFEMAFLGSPSPALKSLDQAGAVVYIGSFSKSLFPGLRLGYIVAAPAFIREARALRSLMMRHPPVPIQRTVAYFLSQGHYDSQLSRTGRTFSRRRQVMEQSLNEHGLQGPGDETFGGSSYWMRAPDGTDSQALAAQLRERSVLIEPGDAFFTPDRRRSGFYRLAYSSIASASIPEGIAHIARAVNSHR